MPRILVVACRQHPVLSKSNQALAEALAAAGADVRTHAWNDRDQAPFSDVDLILLRQTWDYMDDPGGFAAWLIGRRRLGARILNAPDLAIWNNDKRTLTDLTGLGVATPATIPVFLDEPADLAEIPTDKIVLKPAFGGSGIGVELATRGTFEEVFRALAAQHPGRPWLAQEYLPEIADGEWKLTCFDGAAAFAAHMVPAENEFRVNNRYGPQKRIAPPPEPAAKAAAAVAAWLGEEALCFRIDGVLRGDQFICTELELTDPDLHLHLADAMHAERLAAAILSAV